MSTESKIGRPAGSPNVSATGVVIPPRCRACGSSRRTPYTGKKRVQPFGGVMNGVEFTHIVRRNTRCADCDQARIDLWYEYTPDREPDDDEVG